MKSQTYFQRPFAVTAVCNTTDTEQVFNGIKCVPDDFVVTDANGVSYTLDPDTFSKRYGTSPPHELSDIAAAVSEVLHARLEYRLGVVETRTATLEDAAARIWGKIVNVGKEVGAKADEGNATADPSAQG
jgi:hypothetical protein